MRRKSKLIAGVGVNDWPENVREISVDADGRIVKKPLESYVRWSAMLNRCFNKKNPAYEDYKGVGVCEEWLTFSNFEHWYSLQETDGMDIDKDLWKDGRKEYSPETCLMIPHKVNVAIRMRSKSKKGLKIGVFENGSKSFSSKINCHSGRQVHLGTFPSHAEAHKAWQLAKIDQLKELASTQTDVRIINGLHRIAGKIQCEVDNGMETIKLDSLSIVENR